MPKVHSTRLSQRKMASTKTAFRHFPMPQKTQKSMTKNEKSLPDWAKELEKEFFKAFSEQKFKSVKEPFLEESESSPSSPSTPPSSPPQSKTPELSQDIPRPPFKPCITTVRASLGFLKGQKLEDYLERNASDIDSEFQEAMGQTLS